MQAASESKEQFEELGILLEDMKNYLHNVEQGCQELLVMFHTTDKSQPLEILTQIMEGLEYYQKLLKSAVILLTIDLSEPLYEKLSASSLFDYLSQVFISVVEATENEDYSLLTDIIEYDLIPAICISQEMLTVVLGRYEERVM
jgi:hypothetical protein